MDMQPAQEFLGRNYINIILTFRAAEFCNLSSLLVYFEDVGS